MGMLGKAAASENWVWDTHAPINSLTQRLNLCCADFAPGAEEMTVSTAGTVLAVKELTVWNSLKKLEI